MSITLSDRLTRGTYLLDYDGDGAICLTYTWNDDALKFLPLDVKDRTSRATSIIKEIYPDLQFDTYTTDKVTTVSWEDERFFIGAFKNNLPGQYRYQRTLYSQFVEGSTKAQKRFILAGDDVSWTGGWAEGAITTGLNAAHAIVKAFGGSAFENRGPIDRWDEMKPIELR